MKYSKIIFYFGIALPACIVLRFIQLFFTVDFTSGFFVPNYEVYGNLITIAIIVFSAFIAFFAFFAHRTPQNPPKPNLLLSISSYFLAVSVIVEAFISNTTYSSMWQHTLLKIVSVFMVVVLFLYGTKRFFNVEIPKIFAIAPLIYFIVKTIADFKVIYALAIISDNIMKIVAYCVLLLFALNVAKLYSNTQDEYGFRKILASGLSASIFCFVQSVPNIVINLVNGFNYTHTTLLDNIILLCAGLFAAIYTFCYFSGNNCYQ